MSELITVGGEDKRPQVICPNCKTTMILDIRMFNKDMSKLAEYTCHSCRRKVYAGLILLAAPRLETLLEKINDVINASDPKNTIELGKKDKPN